MKLNGNILFFGSGNIEIGNGSTINSGIMANPSAGDRMVFYVLPKGNVIIGENVGISNTRICCGKRIIIGDNTIIGGGCYLFDNDFHSLDYIKRRKLHDDDIRYDEVIIGEDVFIGANTCVLKGTHIGDKSIVAANSVVSRDIPSGQVWGGNPARFIRDIEEG